MFSRLFVVAVVSSLILVLCNPECKNQQINGGPCTLSEKHACERTSTCHWSHHNFCYRCASHCENTFGATLYLPFDGDLMDCSGNHYDGVAAGNIANIEFIDGQKGKAIHLKGDAYVLVHDDQGNTVVPLKLRVQNAMSFASWLYLDYVDYGSIGLGGCECWEHGPAGYEWWLAGGQIGTNMPFVAGGYPNWGPPPAQTWFHATTVVDTQYISLYINGVLMGQSQHWNGNWNGQLDYNLIPECPWHIGHFVDEQGDPYYVGAMDDFMFFDRALTQTEIAAIYNSQTASHKAQVESKNMPVESRKVTALQDHCKTVTGLCEGAGHKAQVESKNMPVESRKVTALQDHCKTVTGLCEDAGHKVADA